MNVTTALYYIPPGSLISTMILLALVALLPAVETVALIRAPRIASQRVWRQWVAVIPLLISLGMLALVILLVVVYMRLTGDPTYTQSAFDCIPTAPVGPGQIGACKQTVNANIAEAFRLYQIVGAFESWGLIAAYAAAVLGFLFLAIGRRKRATNPVTAPASEAITEQ